MNKENQKIISQYLEFISEVKGLSPSTMYTKRQHLTVFLDYLGKRHIKSLKIQDFYIFLKELKLRDRSYYSRYSYQRGGVISLITVQNYMATIRNFIRRSNSSGYTKNIDPTLIQSPKVKRTIINPLNDVELKGILEAPKLFEKRDDLILRNTLLFQVGYLMGLRIREALNLTFKDILNNSSKITIVGKGRRKRTLFIPKIIKQTAKKYKQYRSGLQEVYIEYPRNNRIWKRRIEVPKLDTDLLFIRMDSVTYGKPISKQAICVIFRKYEKALGLKERITYHRLRHTFGTHLLNNNVDLYTLQQMLGHETILATQYYVTADHEKVSNAQKGLLKSLPQKRNHFSLRKNKLMPLSIGVTT